MILEAVYTYLLATAITTGTNVLPNDSATSPPPVSVQVMSESLCIDCQRFFKNSLFPAHRTLGAPVMDLQIIPFGNSRIDFDSKTVTCQHGEAECDANLWEQCAVEQTSPQVYVDFFDCLEGVLPMGHKDDPFEESIFQQCAAAATERKEVDAKRQQAGLRGATTTTNTLESIAALDFFKLKECHDDPAMAWSMQAKFSKLTPSNHEFVPWVLIDHQFIDVDQQYFFQEVCRAYMAKGGSHPACASDDNKDRPSMITE
jgi:hypothetical protein